MTIELTWQDARNAGMSNVLFQAFQQQEQRLHYYAGQPVEYRLPSVDRSEGIPTGWTVDLHARHSGDPGKNVWVVNVVPFYGAYDALMGSTVIEQNDKIWNLRDYSKDVAANVATEFLTKVALRVVPEGREGDYEKRLGVLLKSVDAWRDITSGERITGSDSEKIKKLVRESVRPHHEPLPIHEALGVAHELMQEMGPVAEGQLHPSQVFGLLGAEKPNALSPEDFRNGARAMVTALYTAFIDRDLDGTVGGRPISRRVFAPPLAGFSEFTFNLDAPNLVAPSLLGERRTRGGSIGLSAPEAIPEVPVDSNFAIKVGMQRVPKPVEAPISRPTRSDSLSQPGDSLPVKVQSPAVGRRVNASVTSDNNAFPKRTVQPHVLPICRSLINLAPAESSHPVSKAQTDATVFPIKPDDAGTVLGPSLRSRAPGMAPSRSQAPKAPARPSVPGERVLVKPANREQQPTIAARQRYPMSANRQDKAFTR